MADCKQYDQLLRPLIPNRIFDRKSQPSEITSVFLRTIAITGGMLCRSTMRMMRSGRSPPAMLCGGGAALFGAMVASLLGGTSPVRAAAISGAVPEVDGLAVRVVIDSYQFAVAPSKKAEAVDIQHFGWGIGRQAAWQDPDQRVRSVDACRVRAVAPRPERSSLISATHRRRCSTMSISSASIRQGSMPLC